MPRLYRRSDGGWYAKTTVERRWVTYQVTPKGVEHLKQRGLRDGASFDRDVLFELVERGWAFTGGTGAGGEAPLPEADSDVVPLGRTPCSDEMCTGIIGPSGRCGVCGQLASLGGRGGRASRRRPKAPPRTGTLVWSESTQALIWIVVVCAVIFSGSCGAHLASPNGSGFALFMALLSGVAGVVAGTKLKDRLKTAATTTTESSSRDDGAGGEVAVHPVPPTIAEGSDPPGGSRPTSGRGPYKTELFGAANAVLVITVGPRSERPGWVLGIAGVTPDSLVDSDGLVFAAIESDEPGSALQPRRSASFEALLSVVRSENAEFFNGPWKGRASGLTYWLLNAPYLQHAMGRLSRQEAAAVVARRGAEIRALRGDLGRALSDRDRKELAAAIAAGLSDAPMTASSDQPRVDATRPVAAPSTPGSQLTSEDIEQVFLHLEEYGSITEAELVLLLGSARAVRRFSLEFEGHADKVPFKVRVEVGPEGKRYVREGNK